MRRARGRRGVVWEEVSAVRVGGGGACWGAERHCGWLQTIARTGGVIIRESAFERGLEVTLCANLQRNGCTKAGGGDSEVLCMGRRGIFIGRGRGRDSKWNTIRADGQSHSHHTPQPSQSFVSTSLFRIHAFLQSPMSASDLEDDDSPPPTTPATHLTNRIYANTLSVQLHIDAAPGCGGIAWPAGDVRVCPLSSDYSIQLLSQVLAQYLARRYPHVLNDKIVLELGSGTGLVGLVAARLGATVFITDQMYVLVYDHPGLFVELLCLLLLRSHSINKSYAAEPIYACITNFQAITRYHEHQRQT